MRVPGPAPCGGAVELQRLEQSPIDSSQKRHYSSSKDIPDTDADRFTPRLRIGGAGGEAGVESATGRPWRQRRVLSRRARKVQRQSQPASVLEAIHGSAYDLYAHTPPGKVDLSYSDARLRKSVGWKEPTQHISRLSQGGTVDDEQLPASLYTILARHVRNITISARGKEDFQYTKQELTVLSERGYAEENIQRWASALVDPSSLSAAKDFFLPGSTIPPFFVVLLFLRRKRIQQSALGVLMRHVDLRLQLEPITWMALKLLATRLLRHARYQWPESMPWIASLFATEAARICDTASEQEGLSPSMQSDVIHFCNSFLGLLAMPTNLRPVLSSVYQQDAQFHVLRFMASQSPALPVTQVGFRATMRVQLAHAKTEQEREWARLKGPSWPPWMQKRTAMDEGKGYEFGASRASLIMHQMFEAGYPDGKWEKIVQMYAGWDTDLSPAIQTRTILPNAPIPLDRKYAEELLWAARVRTTRTRREAWACFLAYEASTTPPSQQVYHAMFEKLHYSELDAQAKDVDSESHEPADTMLVPGDRKEILPDPQSPMDRIYIAEPIPSYKQLYHRMREKGVRPTNRFLSFLIETSQDFSMVLELLESVKKDFNGGIQRLLDASLFDKPAVEEIPGYFFTAFIRFLCNFGRWSHAPSVEPLRPSQAEHKLRFKLDRHYLFEYAYALLMYISPEHRPAWTSYMQSVIFGRYGANSSDLPGKTMSQYNILCKLIDKMQEEHMDVDEDQFRLMCTVVRYAAQAAFNGSLGQEDARQVIASGPRQLRSLFHTLVSAHLDPNPQVPKAADNSNPIPPQIPGPAILHNYVRALGMLHDHEGLYSFATWARANAAEITARAAAQHSGLKALRRTLIAMRAALDGRLHARHTPVPEDLVELVKTQVEEVEDWGGWPSEKEVDLYNKGKIRR